MRTRPDSGSGISRSTIASGPPTLTTSTARIFAINTPGSRCMSHRSKVDVSSRRKVPLLFDRFVGAIDEGSDIVVQLLERFFVGVHHVTGLIPRVLNVLAQGGWDG